MESYRIRVWLVILNIILFLIGGAMLAVGVWILTDKDNVLDLANLHLEGGYRLAEAPGFLEVSVFMTAIIGGITVFQSIYNFLAACQATKRSLVMSCFCMVLTLLAQLTTIALLVVHTVTFECCGIENYTDFRNFAENWTDRLSLQIPKACCKLDKDSYLDNSQYVYLTDVDCAWNPDQTETNRAKACYNSISDWLNWAWALCLAMALIWTIFEALTLLLTVTLTCKVHRKKQEKPKHKKSRLTPSISRQKYFF